MQSLYTLLFNLLGWKIEGKFPSDLKKYIVAVAPHTSNWDFLIGVLARSVLRIQHAKFLGKDTLFKPPFGWLFRSLGGYPVNRSSSHDMVQQVVDIFNSHQEFVLALAPEGTRKKTAKLRTGFYFIAKGAKVPIIPCGFDFSRKVIVIGEPFYTTDNQEVDFEALLAFYRKIRGKNPELGID